MSDLGSGHSDDEEKDGCHYARGTFRRLAEEKYHQDRQERLTDYWHRPTGEEVVQVMVKKGWDEEVARAGVRKLWTEEMQRCRGGA